MAGNSVWNVSFHVENSGGKTVAGPYNALVGVSGGTRGDIHNTTVNAQLVTAITNNLLAILQVQGYGGSAAPSGTIIIDRAAHAQSPEVFT
jgi:hypothetical protein